MFRQLTQFLDFYLFILAPWREEYCTPDGVLWWKSVITRTLVYSTELKNVAWLARICHIFGKLENNFYHSFSVCFLSLYCIWELSIGAPCFFRQFSRFSQWTWHFSLFVNLMVVSFEGANTTHTIDPPFFHSHVTVPATVYSLTLFLRLVTK